MHMTRSWNIILSHSEKNVLTLQEHDDLVFCELCVAPGTGTNNRVLVSCWVSLFKGPELLGIRFLLHHTCEPCQTTSRVRVCVHVRKSEPASGSTPVLSTNCGSKLNNQTVTLCHIGACYLVGFSWQTWYVRHVREKLRHNQSKPNTKYVYGDLTCCSDIQFGQPGWWVTSEQTTEKLWSSSERNKQAEGTVRGPNLGVQSHNRTQISWDGNVTATLEIILLHNSLNNFIKSYLCPLFGFVKPQNVGTIQFLTCWQKGETDICL